MPFDVGVTALDFKTALAITFILLPASPVDDMNVYFSFSPSHIYNRLEVNPVSSTPAKSAPTSDIMKATYSSMSDFFLFKKRVSQNPANHS